MGRSNNPICWRSRTRLFRRTSTTLELKTKGLEPFLKASPARQRHVASSQGWRGDQRMGDALVADFEAYFSCQVVHVVIYEAHEVGHCGHSLFA